MELFIWIFKTMKISLWWHINKTILLNYKETVNSIVAFEEVGFGLNNETCEYEYFQFCDSYNKYIISGDLHVTDNSKLRKLITKGS